MKRKKNAGNQPFIPFLIMFSTKDKFNETSAGRYMSDSKFHFLGVAKSLLNLNLSTVTHIHFHWSNSIRQN